MADGVVAFVGQETCLYGSCNTVKVHHNNGLDVWYVHLSSFAPGIASGVQVLQGTWLGNEGDTGAGGVVHIHIELRLKDVPVAWDGKTLEGWQIHQDCTGYDQTKNTTQNNAPCYTTDYNGYINHGSEQAVPLSSGPQLLLQSTNHER
jgi:murein DD-endopeptidase MepM/ murein hydrolase activator NlpD